MKTLYTAAATATSGRSGRVVADDPTLDLALAVPKAFGGPGGDGTNPEQLFAAGYAACFSSALALVARLQKIDVGDPTVTAHVSIGKDETEAYGLAVELVGRFDSLPADQAQSLMEAAHEVCPYSKATRGNVEVTLTATTP
jgi:lipoyl-dependent peroxiredoxin